MTESEMAILDEENLNAKGRDNSSNQKITAN